MKAVAVDGAWLLVMLAELRIGMWLARRSMAASRRTYEMYRQEMIDRERRRVGRGMGWDPGWWM